MPLLMVETEVSVRAVPLIVLVQALVSREVHPDFVLVARTEDVLPRSWVRVLAEVVPEPVE